MVLPGWLRRYTWPVLTVGAADLLATVGPEIFRGEAMAFIFLAAVFVSAVLGGAGPGLVSIVLSLVTANAFVLTPSSDLLNTQRLASEAAFIGVGVLLVWGVWYQRKTERALRLSGAQYHDLVQNANSAIVRWRRDGTVTFFNECAAACFGYTPQEVLGRHVGLLVPKQETAGTDLSNLVDDIVTHPERHVTRVNENICKDGRRVQMLWTNRPIFNERGELVEILAVGSDITEKKQAEDALRESEARLRLIVENSPDILFAQDRDLSYTWMCNPTAPYEPHSVVGKRDEDLLPPEEAARLTALKRRVLETGERFEGEVALTPGQRHTRWFEAVYEPQRDAQRRIVGLLGYSRDVTERKRTEEVLRESEARLRHVMAAGRVFGFDYDVPSDLVTRTESCVPILGLAPPIELQCSGATYFRHVHPEDRERFQELVFGLTPGSPGYQTVYRFERPDGRTVWLEETATAAFDSTGRMIRLSGVTADVTARMEVEDALRRSEQRERMRASELEAVMEAVPGHVWVAHDPECRLITGSRASRELLRLEENANASLTASEQERPTHFRVLQSGRELAPDELPLQRAGRGEEIRDFEEVVELSDGTLHWLLGNATPLRDEEGHVRGAVATFIDITERKRAEGELETSRSLLETVVNRMPAAVCLIRGSDLRLQLVNPAYQAIAPGTPMVGRTLDELWPETGHDFAALCRRVLETGEPHEAHDEPVTIRRTPEGPLEEAYFSWSLHRVKLPGEDGWGLLNAAWETTPRVRAEEALRASEEKFRSSFANAAIGFALAAPDGRVVDANPAYCSLTGYSLQELRTLSIPNLVYPEDFDENQKLLDRMLTGEIADFVLENRYVRKNGNAIWVRKSVSLVRDAQDRPQWIIALVESIAERKRAEEALHALNEELEERVRQRTAELEQSQEALRQSERLAAIGQMMTGLSHESRNALQRSLACAEMLEKRVKDQPELQRLVQEVRSATDELVRVYEGVKDYARPLVPNLRPTDVADVWREAWRKLAVREGRQAELREELDGVSRIQKVDPVLLEQVFRNLFDNALAACTDPVEVEIALAEGAADAEPGLRIRVRDNGPGLPPEVRARAFQPFVTTKTKGTGLGLAIVKRIVEAHGGHVELGPDDSHGLEVVIDLPRNTA